MWLAWSKPTLAVRLLLLVVVALVVGVRGQVEVSLIAHSHCDAGWKKTVEQYYDEQVRTILTNTVDHLLADPVRRFVWAETVYFSWWFGEQDAAMKQAVRALVDSGRLEIVHGGWVMDDEASTLPIARINQFTLGHETLEQIFQGSESSQPTVAWSIDPFGSSSSTPALLRAMGFQVYVNDRISLRTKTERSSAKQLQFNWHGSPSLGEDAVLFTHTLDSWYWVPGFMNWDMGATPVTDDNIQSIALELVSTCKQRADNLLFPFGHDFAFDDAAAMFENMEKLITEINANPVKYGVKLTYKTLSEYFDAIQSAPPANGWPDFSLPKDYLPFEDIPWGGWWVGHYTSRPQLKKQMRVSDASLRAAEVALAYQAATGNFKDVSAAAPLLKVARETSALMNHHDAATGTSKQVIVDDYLTKLVNADGNSSVVLASAITALANGGNGTVPLHKVKEDTVVELSLGVTTPIVFFNSLGFEVCDVARVLVRILATSKGADISVSSADGLLLLPAQVRLIRTDGIASIEEVAFSKCVPALGVTTINLKLDDAPQGSTVAAEVVNVPVCVENASEIFLENDVLMLHFSAVSGQIVQVTNKETLEVFPFDLELLEYASDKSGAYLFTPSGPATLLEGGACPIAATAIVGNLYESIELVYMESSENEDLRVTLTLFKSHDSTSTAPSTQQYGMAARIASNSAIGENKELIARFNTDIQNVNARLYTDNGMFELIEHDYDASWDDKIASNYRPLLTTASINDNNSTRALVVLAAEPHGVASLEPGQMEIMLQRRLMQDDNLGMDEAMDEKAPFQADLFLMFEPSANSTSDTLIRRRKQTIAWDHPVVLLTPANPSIWLSENPKTSFSALKAPLPDAIHLLSFEVRDPVGTPASSVIMRLEHVFPVDSAGNLAAPVQVDLAALWSPGVNPLVSAEEVGLSLGRRALSHDDDLIYPVQIRTWSLDFS